MRFLMHGVVVVVLTVLTQLGGLAWLLSLLTRRRVLAALTIYVALSATALVVAPLFGRTALTCWSDGPVQVRSWVFCALNRTYLAPELLAVLEETGRQLAADDPGTRLQMLDANFPFIVGFPLIPHLSHDDGEKVDLALFYETERRGGNGSPSPIGYFAFESGPTQCQNVWPTLRWDMAWLQPLWPKMPLDTDRTRRLVLALADHPDVGKILLEPHLQQSMAIRHDKVRFQGCRAARHDDHIHLQL